MKYSYALWEFSQNHQSQTPKFWWFHLQKRSRVVCIEDGRRARWCCPCVLWVRTWLVFWVGRVTMSWQVDFVFWRVGLLVLSWDSKSFPQARIFFSAVRVWISIWFRVYCLRDPRLRGWRRFRLRIFELCLYISFWRGILVCLCWAGPFACLWEPLVRFK